SFIILFLFSLCSVKQVNLSIFYTQKVGFSSEIQDSFMSKCLIFIFYFISDGGKKHKTRHLANKNTIKKRTERPCRSVHLYLYESENCSSDQRADP
ncbi:MAG: hypothetical protein IJN82_07290, partial [Clostridia bacterium]|nr:hypothetical protein [Clostridia bacterium]